MRLTFQWIDLVKQIALPNMVESYNLLNACIEGNAEQERIFSFCLMVFELGHWSFLAFGLILEPTSLAFLVLWPCRDGGFSASIIVRVNP